VITQQRFPVMVENGFGRQPFCLGVKGTGCRLAVMLSYLNWRMDFPFSPFRWSFPAEVLFKEKFISRFLASAF